VLIWLQLSTCKGKRATYVEIVVRWEHEQRREGMIEHASGELVELLGSSGRVTAFLEGIPISMHLQWGQGFETERAHSDHGSDLALFCAFVVCGVGGVSAARLRLYIPPCVASKVVIPAFRAFGSIQSRKPQEDNIYK